MNLNRKLLLVICLLCANWANANELWHLVLQQPVAKSAANELVYSLDETTMKAQLKSLPDGTGESIEMELPLPNGDMQKFRVWQSSIMPPLLAAKYPQLRTFTAEAVGQPWVTAKLDFTELGFHAMIFNGENTSFIDPRSGGSGYYKVVYIKDGIKLPADRMPCLVAGSTAAMVSAPAQREAAKTINGSVLRKYRIAIACDHQYAEANTGVSNPAKSSTLSYIVTTMNRINGVYERELAVTLTLVNNEDTLLFVDATTDPFGPYNSDPSTLISVNQQICDSLIGNLNYDVGHIFTTGAGGLSQIGCACTAGSKAMSVTGNSDPKGDGFDIDYVAHEIGHEFGSNHTFNNNASGSCAGNAVQQFAYQPGSGSTIMDYAGICASDDIQKHSDDYFSASSLLQINQFITTTGDVCAVKTISGNKPAALPAYTAGYFIPYLTPFELIAPVATDSVADSSNTYCWEQWNLGDFGKALANTEHDGPLFRSYPPDTTTKRIFPNNAMVLAGLRSNAGIEGAEGDKLPTVARYLTFKLTVRSILHGIGCFVFPDDSIHLDVVNTGSGFTVTSQNNDGLKYIGTSVQTVQWNVAGTNAAPINAVNVDIYLSVDGGNTWQYNLGNFPNNGLAVVTLPNPEKTISNARIKVKGSGNVFFNVNSKDFELINNPGIYGDIQVFPIPAKNSLTVVTGDKGTVQAVIYNSLGRLSWKGEISSITDIDVTRWPRGVYIMKLIDVKNEQTIKKFVLE